MDDLLEVQLCAISGSLDDFQEAIEDLKFELTPARVGFLLVEAARMNNYIIVQYLASKATDCTTAVQFAVLARNNRIVRLLLNIHKDKIDLNYIRTSILPTAGKELRDIIHECLTPEPVKMIYKPKLGPSPLRNFRRDCEV